MATAEQTTLQAIQWEIAREREQGHVVQRIHVTSHGLEHSIVSVPRLGRRLHNAREILVHPHDWERLIAELRIGERMGAEVERVVLLPVEHSA